MANETLRIAIIWLIGLAFCVLMTSVLNGCGGAAQEQALQYVEMTTAKFQPVVNSVDKVCDVAKKLNTDIPQAKELQETCDKLWGALNDIQQLQESTVLILGGEPCSTQCSE